MAVYQQYGTGTGTKTKKKKIDDNGVGVGTKNTNTNTNRLSCVVALMSTIAAVVVVVIVMYVQSLASLLSTTLEEANLLRIGTGTKTVLINDSATAGVVADLPPNIGALLSSFILSNSCVDRLTHKDVPWKNACHCLMVNACPDAFYLDRDYQHQATEIFSSCEKDNVEELDDIEYFTCLNNFAFNGQQEKASRLVECLLYKNHLKECMALNPPSPART